MNHRRSRVSTQCACALGLVLSLATLGVGAVTADAAPFPPPAVADHRGDKVTYRVEPLQVLWVHATGVEPSWSLDSPFLVEPGGTVDLGPAYGKVPLGGLTFDEADDVITERLQKAGVLHPKVFVCQAGVMSKWRNDPSRRAPYHIKRNHVLKIQVLHGPPLPSEDGLFTVGEDGSVDLGPEYGRPKVVDRTLEEAAREIATSCANKVAPPQVSVTLGGWEKAWRQALKPPYRLRPLDLVQIKEVGTARPLSIDGFYLVGTNGQVNLGSYGKVKVDGRTLEEAEGLIAGQLKERGKGGAVSLSLAGWHPEAKNQPTRIQFPKIKPGDVLKIRVEGVLPNQPINGDFKVDAAGVIDLGVPYGWVKVAGLTLEAATTAIETQLKNLVVAPRVQVSLRGGERAYHLLEGGPTRHPEYLDKGSRHH